MVRIKVPCAPKRFPVKKRKADQATPKTMAACAAALNHEANPMLCTDWMKSPMKEL
ncbi:hypothetical protein [Thermus albus]|uniref:hypothetical protein n=1 Tax=Thermus albus TaxID=2908146 RepID=UPI001FAAF3E0|nr:hypothetical protein [Thermus albus]